MYSTPHMVAVSKVMCVLVMACSLVSMQLPYLSTAWYT